MNGGPSTPWTGSLTLGTVAASATDTIVITATVNPSKPDGTTLSNTATVASTTTDPGPHANSATQTTAVEAKADLSIAKTCPATVTAGESITYFLTVTNNGPSDAQDVQVADVLPTGTSGATYSIDGGSSSSYSSPLSLGTLAAGASHSITIVATVNANVPNGRAFEYRVVSSSTTEVDGSDNSSGPVLTTVQTRAEVADLKVAESSHVVAGTDVHYTITVHNAGPSGFPRTCS